MIKYQTGDRTGYWGQNVSEHEGESGTRERGGPGVSFARVLKEGEEGEIVAAMFENNSSVEYVYDVEGNTAEVKVHKGEVIVYRLDLETGESEEVIKAMTGEVLSLAIEEYEAGDKAEGITKSEFDSGEKSEAVKNLEKYWLIDQIKKWGLVSLGAGLAMAGLMIIIKKIRKGRK